MRRILVTGGAGFIGSNFVRYMLKKHTDIHVFVLDALTYAGNLDNFSQEDWHDPRFFFWEGDIRDREILERFVSQVDSVVHFAAETHVDNSIKRTDAFIDTDVKGTQILLDTIKQHPVERFIHISTSEVYGTAETAPMTEEHPLKPRSPYASAKAGADRLVYSYYATYDLPVVIIRPFNNYGPNQHVEKLIPCFITRALENQFLPLQGNGAASRDWVFVEDLCEALDRTLSVDINTVKGEVINVGTGVDTNVMTITKMILEYLNKPTALIQLVKDRQGQVNRHIASTKKAEQILGWKAKMSLKTGLQKTIDWYINNREWWKNLRMFDELEEEDAIFSLLSNNGHNGNGNGKGKFSAWAAKNKIHSFVA